MPGRLLLSPLVESVSGRLRRPSPGKWYEESDFLNQFSKDILVEGTVSHQQIVRGVPSVFAQPIYFTHALEDRYHPAHTAAVGQWRGLLACFALREWVKLPITIDRFDLLGAGSEAPPISSDGVFRQILRSQLPAPEDDWRSWWLIRCEGTLIGSTSPWTLVYPPAHQQMPAAIPWQKDGVLIDPIDHYDPKRQRGSSDELALLGWWVEQLLGGHSRRWGAPISEPWDHALDLVSRVLGQWAEDLARYRTQNDHELANQFDSVPEPYGLFAQTVVSAGIPGSRSLVLQDHQGASRIILKRKGLDEHRRVHGAILINELDLSAMPSSAPGGWTTKSGREVEFGFLFAEEAFLTSRLLEIPLSDQALSLGKGRFALPLRSEIFEYFTLEDLSNGNLELDLREQDGKHVVRLKFPLPDGSTFTVERTYDPREDVVSVDPQAAPSLAYWPDFVSESWGHYIGLFVAELGTSLTARPLTDGEGESGLNSSPRERDERDWVAWASSEPIMGFQLSEDGEEIGLVARRKARVPLRVDHQTTWHVAVDFGTSNTQLTWKIDDQGTPEPLDLKGRTVTLTRGADAYELEARDAFYPSVGQDLPSPFPTVLLQNQGWSATQLVGAPLGQLYSPRFDPRPGASLTGHIKNLKWPEEGGDRSDLPLRSYLKILVQAVTAEAVASGVSKVVFHWSFPLALPSAARLTMRQFWQTVPRNFTRQGLDVTITGESGRSESEAMSRFFAHLPGELPVRAGSLSIAVDIGGGSTDVGFWSANQFLDQLSFKLAGNDLLVPLARKVPGFLESLCEICLRGTPTDAELDAMRRELDVSLNAILRVGVNDVSHAIHDRLPAGEPPWLTVRTAIYLFFAGISFYLGLHSRLLIDDLKRQEFAVLFGGKASGLLSWLSNDPKVLEDALGRMFLAGLGYDDPSLEQSSVRVFGPDSRSTTNDLPPKIEVAYGLLLPPLGGNEPELPSTTIVGEQGWRPATQSEALPWDEDVSVDFLGGLCAPENLESGFAAYLAATLAPRAAEELGLDAENLRRLRLAAQDVENTVRTLADKGVMQPIFATELKQLIERYIEVAR